MINLAVKCFFKYHFDNNMEWVPWNNIIYYFTINSILKKDLRIDSSIKEIKSTSNQNRTRCNVTLHHLNFLID